MSGTDGVEFDFFASKADNSTHRFRNWPKSTTMVLRILGWVVSVLALTLATAAADEQHRGEHRPAPKCNTDEDCSLNGICQLSTATCLCDAAWGGDVCSTLNLLPVPADPAAAVAVAYPPPDDFNTTTSWGGSVVKAEDGLYHMFAAEMLNSCGMTT